MKKLLILAVAALLTVSLKAQDITFGPKFGWNVSNITNSDAKNKMSFHLGAFAEIKMSDFVAIQPELVYSRQGARDKIDGMKFKYRVNYLNIPILAKLYVLDELSVDLGPQIGFALNGKTVAKHSGTTVKTKNKNLNTVEIGWAIGLTYEYEAFLLSARYNLGLSNVMDKDVVHENNKNHVFQLSVGYRIGDLF